MMRRLLVFCLLFTFAFSSPPAPTYAQDTAKCDPAPLFSQAATLKASGDAKQDIADLSKFADAIRQANITCNGFKFEGKGNKAIGTVELPDGIWLVTVTTKGFFSLQNKTLSGQCANSGISDELIFLISRGSAEEGAATIIEATGCRMLLIAENVTEAWTLTFEPVS